MFEVILDNDERYIVKAKTGNEAMNLVVKNEHVEYASIISCIKCS
jgi:hypothetical protein